MVFRLSPSGAFSATAAGTAICGRKCQWHAVFDHAQEHVLKPLPELTAVLEGLPEPLILFGARYRILAANMAYRRTYGGQRDVVGRTCTTPPRARST